MKTRFSSRWSNRSIGSTGTSPVRTARSVCEDGTFGFREFVRLCTRSALTGVVLVSGISPNLRACDDIQSDSWQYNAYQRDDGYQMCLVAQWQSHDYYTDSNSVTQIFNTAFWEEEACTPTPPPGNGPGDGGGDGGGGGGGDEGTSPDDCGVNPFRAYDGSARREIRDLVVAGAAGGKLTWSRHHNTVPLEDLCYFGRSGAGGTVGNTSCLSCRPPVADAPAKRSRAMS